MLCLFVSATLRPQPLRNQPTVVQRFKTLAGDALLFTRSHELSLEEFDISIRMKDGAVLSYKGSVPELHPDDFSIDFHDTHSGMKSFSPAAGRGSRLFASSVQ